MDKNAPPRGRFSVTYKLKVRLFTYQWDRLEAEAHRRKCSGTELVEHLLSAYADTAPEADEPLPSDPPEFGSYTDAQGLEHGEP
jgi:hypothetical protein